MDLLCNAYSTASDEDEETEKHILPPLKRAKPEFPHTSSRTLPVVDLSQPKSIPPETPIAGRYISKRERALIVSASQTSHPGPVTYPARSPVQGSISDSRIRKDVLLLLRNPTKEYSNSFHTSERVSTMLTGHTKAVNAIQWSNTHYSIVDYLPSSEQKRRDDGLVRLTCLLSMSIKIQINNWVYIKIMERAHLLASAGMDSSIYIWNVWNTENKKSRVLNVHTAAVKDIQWSTQGPTLLSCGYDCSSRIIDVEKGLETRVFKEDQVVGVVKFHPNNSNLFLSGGSNGIIRLWDIRTGNEVNRYARGLGPILDLEFMNNTREFISSSDESRSNISENSIIVWDVSRQVPLSNQIYVEAYTCPCIQHHPTDPYFVAQSNGNYIAIFSSKPPFRLDKYKRYESHGVSGFPIKCNFSPDGKKLATGSSDGCIYFYDTKTCQLIKKTKVYEQTCIDVAFHPIISNIIASCSWSGEISVFE